MTAEELQELEQSLDSTGPLGIEFKFPDGTRYDWDPVLQATVEISPAGERFVVALQDGEIRRVRELPASTAGVPVYASEVRSETSRLRARRP